MKRSKNDLGATQQSSPDRSNRQPQHAAPVEQLMEVSRLQFFPFVITSGQQPVVLEQSGIKSCPPSLVHKPIVWFFRQQSKQPSHQHIDYSCCLLLFTQTCNFVLKLIHLGAQLLPDICPVFCVLGVLLKIETRSGYKTRLSEKHKDQ